MAAMTDHTITPFPKKKRETKGDSDAVFAVQERTCWHDKFIVDEKLEQVECADCGERLNPMWVLKRIATKEDSARRSLEKLHGALRDAKQAKRWKCGHCNGMNDITAKMRFRAIGGSND